MADQPAIFAPNRKYVSTSFTNTDPYYSTIQAAVNSITDQSATNAYGIYIYPGTYRETVTLKSYVSLIGAGIDDVVIKGSGTCSVITGPAADSGSGQCYICNLTIDGNGQSAIPYGDTSTAKTNFIADVKIITSQSSGTAITVGNNQSLNCIGLACLNSPGVFTNGIRVTGAGSLRMWQSSIYVGSQYCILHSSSAYTEAYSCLFGSGYHSFLISQGKVNIYNCTLAGGIDVSGSCLVKHVNSLHDGPFNASGGAKIWVTGMKWPEESGNYSVWFTLTGSGSQIIVSNSKAAVVVSNIPSVVSVEAGTIFKALNSEFTHTAGGETISGPSGVVVYLYYCVLSKDVNGVGTGDSVYIKNVSSE